MGIFSIAFAIIGTILLVIFMRQFYVANSQFIDYYDARGEINSLHFKLLVLCIIVSFVVYLLQFIRKLFMILQNTQLQNHFMDVYIEALELIYFLRYYTYIFIGLYIYKIVVYIVHATYNRPENLSNSVTSEDQSSYYSHKYNITN
jgi:hypothetical protein